jgi:hypothetical protein
MSVLNDALEKHPHPEIFNTDQGSQYTSEIHTKRLKDLGITISMDGKVQKKLIFPAVYCFIHYPKTFDNFLKFLI